MANIRKMQYNFRCSDEQKAGRRHGGISIQWQHSGNKKSDSPSDMDNTGNRETKNQIV